MRAELKPSLRRVNFRLDSHRVPGAKWGALVGSFNGWDRAVHRLELGSDGWWSISLALAPGTYNYLFIVDAFPHNDPEDDGRTPSEWGGDYSVRIVR